MIYVYRWNRTTKLGEIISPELVRAQPEELRASGDLFWIDLENPSADEEQLIFDRFFRVHPLTVEDVTKMRREPGARPHFPKAEEFKDYLFVIVNPLTSASLEAIRERSEDGLSQSLMCPTQLSALLTETLLITHHYEPLVSVEGVQQFLKRHERQSERGPDYLFHLILDAAVDQYAGALDYVENGLDQLESMVFKEPSHNMLAALLSLKREIVLLRKTLVYEREVLARLARGEFALIDDRETVYYRNVYDHLIRFTELVETAREMVTDLMHTHLSAMSNKLNEIMKVLTMISTMVLPMTLIAGIYGMNFKHQPEYDWNIGYFWALILMLVTGVVSFGFFRWRKWV